MPLEFTRSDALTFGIELELMVVNTHSYDLSRGAADILPRLARLGLPGEVKPEITESMIEINSRVNRRYDQLLEEMIVIRDGIVATAEKLNLAVAGGGSHPFHRWSDRRIYPTERFRHVSELYGYLAKQFTVFGQHIHIGVASGDDAVYLTHRMAPFIPHFIALSAASPFYQGEDTSFETSRLHAVSAFPLSGHMPEVGTWEEFGVFFDEMRAYGIVQSMKDFYWDIRPKPEYGTIEVRICDTPLTVELAAQLAAYAQTLAADLLLNRRNEPVAPLYRVYGYNRFQACRFGFEASLVYPYSHGQARLREDLLTTLERLAPTARELGTEGALHALELLAERKANGSLWLRECYEANRSLADVVRMQSVRWATTPSRDSSARRDRASS
ncbi:MAG TPA: YbdK family carboxylate-amine ligase [Usitatibacter sp.]|nr:YbdK family carboxylate-amine ligase [Usitatibacter sp.]